MVQRGGTVKMNVQNVTLLVCVATLVMVACVLFKTCVNEGFAGPDSNNANKGVGGSGNGQGGRGNGNRPNNGHNHGNNYHNNGGSSEYSVSDCSGCTGTNFGSNNCPSECE